MEADDRHEHEIMQPNPRCLKVYLLTVDPSLGSTQEKNWQAYRSYYILAHVQTLGDKSRAA